ncbi:hypothetical protein DL768_002859 [Monosporascus sp. mg162]|nr:hypothetical protein DL768_002859 [Monosporascus sp. mg162]
MCKQPYKGFPYCFHADPDAAELPVHKCRARMLDRGPECERKEWVCIYDGYQGACPTCSGNDPSIDCLLSSFGKVYQDMLDMGIPKHKADAARALAEEDIAKAKEEASKGPENHFYARLREAHDRFDRTSLALLAQELENESEPEEEIRGRARHTG